MTTSSYFGVSRPFGRMGQNNVSVAATSTSTTEIELRINVVTNVGAHNMTKNEAVNAIKQILMYVQNSDFFKGEGGASSNIPLPIGAPTAGG